MTRIVALTGAALGVLVVVLVLTGSRPPGPQVMAALGDSLTIALRACSDDGSVDCRARSWSTGTSPAVDSHLLRLRRRGQQLAAYNLAVSARKVELLDGQVRQAVARGADYVTILMGTNDVCREDLARMTPVATFRNQVSIAISTLAAGRPRARIFVASLPDPERLRELFASDARARAVWARDDTCAVFLRDPLSQRPPDRARRALAGGRRADFDRALADACAMHQRCVFDAGAVSGWDFGREHISAADYFHFSTRGQAELAARTFRRAFPATDRR